MVYWCFVVFWGMVQLDYPLKSAKQSIVDGKIAPNAHKGEEHRKEERLDEVVKHEGARQRQDQ